MRRALLLSAVALLVAGGETAGDRLPEHGLAEEHALAEPMMADVRRESTGGRHLLSSLRAARGKNAKTKKRIARARNRLHSMNKSHKRHIRAVSAKAKKTKKRLVKCSQPESPSNGQVKVSHKNVGGSANYKCNRGFVLEGKRFRHHAEESNATDSSLHC